jgi:hypothetical protein
MFNPRFDLNDISKWSQLYPAAEDRHVEFDVAPRVRARRYYTRTEFLDLCRWKTPRSKPLVESNLV